jgi:hypothetical protein
MSMSVRSNSIEAKQRQKKKKKKKGMLLSNIFSELLGYEKPFFSENTFKS